MWFNILKKVNLVEEWIKWKMSGWGLFFNSGWDINELTNTELQYLSNVTQSQYEELFESLFNSAKEKDKPSDEDGMNYWDMNWSNTSRFSYDVFKDDIDHTISWRKEQKERADEFHELLHLGKVSLDKLIEMAQQYRSSSEISTDDRGRLYEKLREKIVDVILAINPQAHKDVVAQTSRKISYLIFDEEISSKKEIDDWLDKNYGTPKRNKNYEQHLMAQAAKRKPKKKKRRGRY